MKFRDGYDKAFLATVRARVAADFRARGIGPQGDWRILVKGIVLGSTILGLYLAILGNRLGGPALLVAVPALGVACILLSFNVAHDAAHDALTRDRRWNRILFTATFLLNGTSPSLWRRRHVGSHHTFPNVRGGDADMDDNAFLRVTPSSPYRWYFAYQHLYAPLLYLLFSLYSVVLYDFQFFFRDRLANIDLKGEIRTPKAVAVVVLEKSVYLFLTLLLPLCLVDRPWWVVVLGWVLLQCASSLAFTIPLVSTHIAEGIAFPEADGSGRVDGGWASHQLATSMDYSPESRAANWILGAVNAHAAHHLFPEVCHVHYVEISRIIGETAREHGIRYNAMPFGRAIRSHFRHLKRMGSPDEIPTPPEVPVPSRPSRCATRRPTDLGRTGSEGRMRPGEAGL